jgi:hypothetical protein
MDKKVMQAIGRRPKACANIYKHGFLKNESEMKKERERIMKLRFNDLLKECEPFTQEKLDYMKELVDGVEIDLDEKLGSDDD